MIKPIPLEEFVSLGQTIGILSNPAPFHATAIKAEIDRLHERLAICGLTQSHSAAAPLAGWNLLFMARTGHLTPQTQVELIQSMTNLVEGIYSEIRARKSVELDNAAVPARMRAILSQLSLTQCQKNLHDETSRCLEYGANRAAIVMGWAFFYDIVRFWVYNDSIRLASFNTELATLVKRNGNRLYDDIVHYDDFYHSKAPGEATFIDVCEGIVGGKICRRLKHYLDLRNDYAHATSSQPTLEQTKAYFDHLTDIVTNPPFHQPAPPK